MQLNKDDQFEYEPKHSEKFKTERIEKLMKKGLNFNGLSIGDPEDKPSKEFFDKGINLAREDLGDTFSFSNCIMVGDSYKGDLETPKALGFALVVLFNQEASQLVEIEDRYVQTNDLSKLIDYLS